MLVGVPGDHVAYLAEPTDVDREDAADVRLVRGLPLLPTQAVPHDQTLAGLTRLVKNRTLLSSADECGVIMTQVNLYEAKTQLSSLVERASAGEEIIIAKAGRPRARLVALPVDRPVRRPGRGKHLIRIDPSFDAPLPDDIANAFGDIE